MRGCLADGIKPAVCFFTDSPSPSGLGEHILTLAAHLVGSCVISLIAPPSEEGLRLFTRAHALGVNPVLLSWMHTRAAFAQLSEWLRRHGPDVFHIHAGIGWEALSAASVAREAGIPVVVRTEHLPYLLTQPEHEARYAAMLPDLDHVICVSDAVRDSFISAGVSPSMSAVVPNGITIRTTRHKRAPTRAQLGLSNTVPIVLTVARLTEQKGHSTLIDAVPRVLERMPECRFLLVGTGPLENAIRAAVLRHGIETSVSFLGYREDVPHLMAAADLLVLPSRFEGLPLVVLEAMAAGLPVIATRVCGTDQAIVNRVTGVLIPPDDPVDLAKAITELLSCAAERKRLAAGGRARVCEHFNGADMASTTLEIYRSLLQSARYRVPEVVLSSERVRP
jgi:glycosyltransferase involved in cell wall biosynthesis